MNPRLPVNPRSLPGGRRAMRRAGSILALTALIFLGTPWLSLASTSGTATPDASEASFLFVQTFSGGTWQPIAGEEDAYRLILNDVGVETIYFTDRPIHRVGLMPTWELLESLGFTEDFPPNAALATRTDQGELEVIVLELLNPVYDEAGGTLTYDAVVLADYDEAALAGLTQHGTSNWPDTFGSGQLFIDSSNCDPDQWWNCKPI